MRKLVLVILLILTSRIQLVQAQGANASFDSSLQHLTDQLSVKLTRYTSLKMAVWELTDLDGGVSPIGKYVAEDISINLSDKFHVANRNLLSTLIKENKLRTEGFINQATLTQFKKLSDINILITGTIAVLPQNIKITLQALDVDGNILAATKGDVVRNDNINELLGVNTGSSNQGFNRSLNSNEQKNSPQTVGSECASQHTGDYCFRNSSKDNLSVTVDYVYLSNGMHDFGSDLTFNLKPGESKCINGLIAYGRRYNFVATRQPRADQSLVNCDGCYDTVDKGNFLVEQCKSRTYEIK
ncbi:CsgG/HfaB family protein [Mucilaginibacter gossypii]|uniref:CsgG/HfaB family protein n=1 Tax=Mucilaginibacter gossypii TaxID=551996 RepID=UPI00101A73B1|nr:MULTISPECIES: CsgG/HfaB family protein [Mucilaginibacter]QTE35886.1 CsgG/HfaB family protein [Mucilaginibacter gossypii]